MQYLASVPRFFLALVVAATVLVLAVFIPLASELILAAMLAVALWPLQARLSRLLFGWRGVAAAVLTIGVIVLILGPLATLVMFFIRDGSDALVYVSELLSRERLAGHLDWLPRGAREVILGALDRLPKNLEEAMAMAGAYKGETIAAVSAAVTATGSLVFHSVLMLIALFFLLVRGDELVSWLDGILPLGRGQTRELLTTFRKVSYTSIVAAAVTAAAQAVAALAGFYIARVPSPIFFAVLTFFLAFIPSIGAAVVCLMAALLLFLSGHPYMALFLAAWGLVVVGLVDNVVKPLMVRRGMEIHGAIVFFALLGGLAAFGPIGLLVGPLAVSFFLALVRIYHRDYAPPAAHAAPGDTDQAGDMP